jgi:hypothetical protein
MPIRLAGAALVNPSFCRNAVIFRAESVLLAGTVVPGQVVKSPSQVTNFQAVFGTHQPVRSPLPARESTRQCRASERVALE